MANTRPSLRIAGILLFFASYWLLDHYAFARVCEAFTLLFKSPLAGVTTAYLTTLVPLYIGLHYFPSTNRWGWKAGLDRGFLAGIGVALGCTLPMFLGYGIIYSLSENLAVNRLLAGALLAGFFEEFAYRGFLFGQLFRFTPAGFIPAALPAALIFAAGHLYQGHNLVSALGVFSVAGLGALFFSWIYAEWDYNLWLAAGLHVFMNLAWMLFDSDNATAAGGTWNNLFRAFTIALAIIITIIYKKKKNIPWRINRDSLWWKTTPGNRSRMPDAS